MTALSGSFTDDFVFIDEGGANINMERGYGRAPGSERAVDYAPVNTTVTAGMTTQGPAAWDTWQGGTAKERLPDWVENTLIPALHAGQVVISGFIIQKKPTTCCGKRESPYCSSLHTVRTSIRLKLCGRR